MNDVAADALSASFERLINLINAKCDIIEAQLTQRTNPNEQARIAVMKHDFAAELEALAPIRSLLEDDSVNDILINGPHEVYIEQNGKMIKTDISFADDHHLWKIASDIAARVNRYLDPQHPMVDARLSDGSRVNIVTFPLALDGTVISIRKFSKSIFSLDNLVTFGSLSQEMAELLKVAAMSKLSILVVGGTGSGKTTLLNAISQHINPEARVITIEDSAELRLAIPHKVRMEAKPHIHGQPGYTEVTIRDLVKNALRMRPDRIIVGETRGEEAFDIIQAMNTGHEGSMTTIHSNNPRDALIRLENMVMMAVPNLPQKAIRQQISSAVNLVVMIARQRDGKRRVTHISEVVGMEGETIVTQDLFEFRDEGDAQDGKVKGVFRSNSILPRFAKQAVRLGFKDKLSEIFKLKL